MEVAGPAFVDRLNAFSSLVDALFLGGFRVNHNGMRASSVGHRIWFIACRETITVT